MKIVLPTAMLALVAGAACADPVTYQVDPGHTYPSFEADHFGGMSVWRGKFDNPPAPSCSTRTGAPVRSTSPSTSARSTSVTRSSTSTPSPRRCSTWRSIPTATYKGTLSGFKNGAPTEVDGTFTLHGVSKPLKLTIDSFKCMTIRMDKKEHCGADATATFNRADYGIAFGDKYGFKMDVKLAIQVEAVRAS